MVNVTDVLEPYTLREARVHVRHVRDLMCSGGQQDKQEAYSGERGCSVSVLDTVMDETGRLGSSVCIDQLHRRKLNS